MSPAARLFVASLWLAAVAQAVLVSLTGNGQPPAIAVILALALSSAVVTVVRVGYRLALVGLLSALIVTNVVFHVSGLSEPLPYRLWHVAVLATYGAIGLAALATVFLRVAAPRAYLVSGALAVAVLAPEGAVDRLLSRRKPP